MTSSGYPDSFWIRAASFIVKPFSVAPFNAIASPAPPAIVPEIAPHLKPSLPANAAAFIDSFRSPVSIPLTTPADTPLNTPDESAIIVPVLAEAAKIILTAGAPAP